MHPVTTKLTPADALLSQLESLQERAGCTAAELLAVVSGWSCVEWMQLARDAGVVAKAEDRADALRCLALEAESSDRETIPCDISEEAAKRAVQALTGIKTNAAAMSHALFCGGGWEPVPVGESYAEAF